MEMNKNYLIAALAVLLIAVSIWGSVGSRSTKALTMDLAAARGELGAVRTAKAEGEKSAGERLLLLEGELAAAKEQLLLAGQQLKVQEIELIKAREEAQPAAVSVTPPAAGDKTADSQVEALQMQLEQKTRALVAFEEKIQQLLARSRQLDAAREAGEKTAAEARAKLTAAEAQITALKKDASGDSGARETLAKLQKEMEAATAQIIGMEKLVEEKKGALAAATKELAHVRVNTDVLLAKISDQQAALQRLQDEKRQLLKDLHARNEQLKGLQSQEKVAPNK